MPTQPFRWLRFASLVCCIDRPEFVGMLQNVSNFLLNTLNEPVPHEILPLRRILTFGTYDVFHVGHLALLERARGLGDTLIVGISTDALNLSKKGRLPVFSADQRMRLVQALRCVDEVFLEESLERKRDYLLTHRADILAMGDDWAGRFDEFSDICKVVYFPRTPAVSTSAVIEKIKG